MQAKSRILKIFLVALIASLLLGACYGGSSGRVWFNLPSLPVRLDESGVAKVYGFTVGAILPPATIQQWQAGEVEKIELRIGYNGIHAEFNGADMPYLSWDEQSTANLGELLSSVPTIPNGNMIASALPWLRKIGLGAILYIPPGDADFERWNGETTVTPENPEETTIGPITIGLLAFDADGNASIQGMPISTLEQALGTEIPLQLDPSIMAILSGLGAEKLTISTFPNGVNISINEDPLPGIAYDTARLDTLLQYAPALGVDPATMATLNQIVPLLPGADVTVVVSFTGEPAVETEIAPIVVDIDADGKAVVMGIPLGDEPLLDAETLGSLQEADVQQLNVEVAEDGLFLAANGTTLPSITWDDASIETLAQVVGPMAGIGPEAIDGLLGVVRDIGLAAAVTVPPADGAAPIDVPAEIDHAFAAADLGDMAPPTIRANLVFDDEGNLKSIGTLSAADVDALSSVALPPDAMAALSDLGAGNVKIVTDPNQLNVQLDGATALSLGYDAEALQAALVLAAPFLGDTPLSDPAVNQLLVEHILPLAPGADVDVDVTFE